MTKLETTSRGRPMTVSVTTSITVARPSRSGQIAVVPPDRALETPSGAQRVRDGHNIEANAGND
jgi:hypothetical protein